MRGGFVHWILLNRKLNILVVWQAEVPVKKAFTIDDSGKKNEGRKESESSRNRKIKIESMQIY